MNFINSIKFVLLLALVCQGQEDSWEKGTKSQAILKKIIEELDIVKIELSNAKNSLEEFKENSRKVTDYKFQLIKDHFERQLEMSRKDIENSEQKINVIKSQQEQQTSDFNSIKSDTIPIGYLYTQFGWTESPQDLWPSFKWLDVTSNYGGLFFRAQGGDSLQFGQIQQDNQSFFSQIHLGGRWYDSWNVSQPDSYRIYRTPLKQGEWVKVTTTWQPIAVDNLRILTTGGEVRPKNMAIKIWKRIK